MDKPAEPLTGGREYAFYVTMNETLTTVSEFVELAQHAASDLELGVYLKMASRSMRCALEIYGEKKNETV